LGRHAPPPGAAMSQHGASEGHSVLTVQLKAHVRFPPPESTHTEPVGQQLAPQGDGHGAPPEPLLPAAPAWPAEPPVDDPALPDCPEVPPVPAAPPFGAEPPAADEPPAPEEPPVPLHPVHSP